MTTNSPVERRMPAILEDLYLASTPDYRDEVFATAVRNTQRAAWTFPGRWIPMLDVAARPVLVPRLPLRAIGLALLIIALLIAALAIVGSGSRTPLPFGPAHNGLITWALDGDIWTGDPLDGTVRRVVASDDIDRNPTFSRDGTHVAFLRQVPSETGRFDLIVTRPDGSSPITLTPAPVEIPDPIVWTPDGRSLLVNEPDGRLTRYFLDTTPPQVVLDGVHLEPDAFRPPDGTQVLYERIDDPGALYVMNTDGSDPHQLFGPGTAPCSCALNGPARWSPDGRLVAFAADAVGSPPTRIFVIKADGSGLRAVTGEGDGWNESDPAWSPDGTRLALNRWQRTDSGDWMVRPVAVVDAASGALTSVGVAPAAEGALIEWAPDGRSILALPGTLVEAFTWSPDANGTVARPVLIDLTDGSSRLLDWSVGSIVSWQRLGS